VQWELVIERKELEEVSEGNERFVGFRLIDSDSRRSWSAFPLSFVVSHTNS